MLPNGSSTYLWALFVKAVFKRFFEADVVILLAEDESLFFLGEDLFAIDDISRYNFVLNCYANQNKNWEKCKSDWISCFPFLKFSKFYRAVQALSDRQAQSC